jgi:hypothetical protein
MRAALIPPKGLYDTAMQSDIHLVLAQHTMTDYVVNYMYNVGDDDFVIVDNGAAEGNMVSFETLLQRAYAYGAEEIVLPDVIGDFSNTMLLVEHSLVQWKQSAVYGGLKFPQAMAVVQSNGASSEWQDCIRFFERFPQITTLGIPRHFVDKDKWMRHQVLSWIKGHDLDKRFQVHLLGTNPKFPAEVSVLAKDHSWVRSVDSSLPYNYAIAGQPLDAMPRKEPIGRPDGYFTEERKYDQDQRALVIDNINTFMRWASGTEGTAR